ncbi:MAG: GFA family protein [Mesorhizobium sp.]|uniref:GFA family protein n=1 Tax=unclassified Mesorhizobium TaxID=325217 RepID=UPI000F75E6F7|nr:MULTISPECIES: GFA family protein [unclassified Mesorhizobium]AZO56273.1 GFA family protein [Mesorhizobium sp. M8A.F.Ca.ET.057.01.1.1]RWE38842.1 MAG: GFA family protein [Mesorhizobium sp.]RWE41528.1 MAG: GFA family protein [Mesorhizobium sp.]TJX41938.1 MAG: GFA family protein [Mesorhizobium sp.]
MSDTIRRTGSCLCGGVQFSVRGPPLRIGLCHCKDCRKAGGSTYSAFAIWPREAFEKRGLVSSYGTRSFCQTCGGRVARIDDNEAEVMIGSLDVAPTDLVPEYELWTSRRETWLHALPGAEQFKHDRPAANSAVLPAPRSLSDVDAAA